MNLARHVFELVEFLGELFERDVLGRALIEVSTWRGRLGTLRWRVGAVGHGGEAGLVLHPQGGAPETASELHGAAYLPDLGLAQIAGLA